MLLYCMLDSKAMKKKFMNSNKRKLRRNIVLFNELNKKIKANVDVAMR